MVKLNWVIDAQILYQAGELGGDYIKFLTFVKSHIVNINTDIYNEYRPAPNKEYGNPPKKSPYKGFLDEWLKDLTDFFGKPRPPVSYTPDCLTRELGRRKSDFKKKDCIYVRTALNTHDGLLTAEEYHFRCMKECIESCGVTLLSTSESLKKCDSF